MIVRKCYKTALSSVCMSEYIVRHNEPVTIRKSCNFQNIIVRHIAKRKYPPNPEKAAALPVFQYPVSSPSDKRVYVWGTTVHGALGNPKHFEITKKTYLLHAQRMAFAEQHKVIDVTCGYGFTALAVKAKKGEHKLYGTGLNTDSQIGYHAVRQNHPLTTLVRPLPIHLPLRRPETNVIKLSAGRAHMLVLTDNEGVFTLGNNAHGQCGRQIIEDEDYVKNHIIHNIGDVGGCPIVAVECGQDHSLFINSKGEVYACGWGADGQTGLGHYKVEWRPSRVVGDIQGENIVKVACTVDCTLALNDKGEVFGWGNAEYGQLLDHISQQVHTSKNMTKCNKLGRIVDIASGGSSCLILNENGEVFTWGYGILGKGPKAEIIDEPSQIPSTLFGWNEFNPDSKVVSVALGISHAAAITNRGDLYMWGHNKGACLGLGHQNVQYFPLKVALGAYIEKIALGVDHSVALCHGHV